MNSWPPFRNREEAGHALAQAVGKCSFENPIVLAMPRGGVPVAIAIATEIDAPLDFVFVRRIGFPGHKEVAMAAVVDGTSPELVLNEDLGQGAGIPRSYVEAEMQTELQEIERRRREYAGKTTGPDVAGCTAILVDDGIATGTSIRAAINALRRKAPKKLVIAVPVAPRDTVASLRPLVDEIICLQSPDPFYAVGMHYEDFHQISDEEVSEALAQFRRIAPRDRRAVP